MPKRPWTPYAVLLWHRALFWQPLQPWFVKETAFFFAKAQNSGIRLVPDSGAGCRFYTQSFVYAQSFAFAVFATLICQINSVFPCKDTKAAKSVAFCDSLPVFLWHRALFMHRALRIGTGTAGFAAGPAQFREPKQRIPGCTGFRNRIAVFMHRASFWHRKFT